jgi:predicted XRE-type DNA-binding protein
MAQNVFLESGFEPDEATVLALEADTGAAIARCINRRFPNNQAAAARHLRIGQNEVSAILAGNLSRFSLAKLIRIARRAELRLFLDMGETANDSYANTVTSGAMPVPAVMSGVSYAAPLLSLEDLSEVGRPVFKGAGTSVRQQ